MTGIPAPVLSPSWRAAIIKVGVVRRPTTNASAAASLRVVRPSSLTTTAYVGDWIEVVSNGVSWLLSGSVKAQNGLTIA